MIRTKQLLFVVGLTWLVVSPAQAQAPRPTGAEVQVNVVTAGDQGEPDIASLADGSSIVVWASDGQDGDQEGIFGRRFSGTGVPVTATAQINDDSAFPQQRPSVTAIPGGGYAVAWDSHQENVVGPFTQAFFARFDDTDQRLHERPVSIAQVFFSSTDTDLAADASGGVTVTWTESGIGASPAVFARRYLEDGSPDGGVFGVSGSTVQFTGPAIDGVSGGDLVAAWRSNDPFGPPPNARVEFRPVSEPAQIGPLVEVAGPDFENGPVAIDGLPDGRFVVAWSARQTASDPWAVFARTYRYAKPPVATGPAVLVDLEGRGAQEHPDVALRSDGSFFVVWESDTTVGGDHDGRGVRGHAFAWDGVPLGSTVQVNTVTAGDQTAPAVTTTEEGFAVVWQSTTSGGDDTDGTSVQLRTFTVPPVPGMVSWWPGDGDATDAVGGNDGMLEGVTFGPTSCGEAFVFDDPSDAMIVADDLSLDRGTENFSLAFWVRTVDEEGVDAILDKRSESPLTGYHAFLLDGRPGLQIADGGGSSTLITPQSVADGVAHFVAITVDRQALFGTRFFVDGVLDATYDTMNTSGSLDAAAPLVVGRRGPETGNDAPFTGTLDEIQLFGRVLTVEEIKQLYLRCAAPFVDGFETGDTSGWAAAVP